MQREEIIFHDHHIQLLTERGAVPFSEKHKAAIHHVLEKYWAIDPQTVQGYHEFISQNRDEIAKQGFPLNGENGPLRNKENTLGGAINFTKRGMSMSIAHRVSSATHPGEAGFVDNFSGTLAHELAHGTNPKRHDKSAGFLYDENARKSFDQDWQKMFGWQHTLKEGKLRIWTTQPEKCIGGASGYAATTWQEDIPDSLAAYLLNPAILHSEKYSFIHIRIPHP